MDIEGLITQITKEVIAELTKEASVQGAKTVCLLFLQVDIDIDGVLKQIEKIKGKNTLKIIFPKWAQNLYGTEYWKDIGFDVKYLDYDNLDNKDMVLGLDEVIVFSPTDGFLSQLTRMAQNTLPAYIVLQAIALHKKVTVIEEYIKDSSLAKFKSKIKSLGIGLASIKDLGTGHSEVKVSSTSSIPQMECTSSSSRDCTGCLLCVIKRAPVIQRFIDAGASRIGAGLGVTNVPSNIASYIDHTILKPDATEKDIAKLCEEARQYNFAAVCINPSYVPLCAKLLAGTLVKVCTVVGFPLGATTTETKVFETRTAVANGATEIDMVINVGALKSANYEKVEKDIRSVVDACQGRVCKVILETALLNEQEKIMACKLSKVAGADFVKTSTGFGPGGATEADVALMRRVVGTEMGVKASGGVKNYEVAVKMIQAGATRVGASASVTIMKEAKA